jgi:hypothetical protein
MTRAALKRIAREAFFEGVRNGGDSAEHDGDHAAIMRTMSLVFESWWARQYPGLDDKAGP